MPFVEEGVNDRLDVQALDARAFKVEVLALDVSLHARLLQAERVEVTRVDCDAVAEPERQEEQPLQPRVGRLSVLMC